MMPAGPLEIQSVYGGGGGMDVTDACLLSPAVTGHPPHPTPPNPRPPFHPITPNPLTSFTPGGVRRRYNRSNARHVGTNLALPEVSDICVLCTSCVNFCITPHSPPSPPPSTAACAFYFLFFLKPNLLNCEILASNNQFGKREEGEIKFTSASAFGLIIIIEKAGTKNCSEIDMLQ